ncbi:MAG: alpha/beta fold hydrolase [Chloroflexi bacterium]|nr:alpha/beta fold hydrolase [Chloroflexota bacterium]MDA1228084.1 alpha/beta fold hydrolase [Chloroflexota bacterium]
MPYFDNNGVQIHYQVDGQGPPLVLMHGTSGSIADWHENGWVSGLKDDYRLILIDHRGHGYSGKPHGPDSYSLETSVSDIVGVLNELGIDKAGYFGYSMGGYIGYGLAKYAPERFTALVIGASHPYERSMAATRRAFERGDMEAYIKNALASAPERADSDWYRVRKQANDLKALRALTKDRPDNSDIIPTMTMPCFVYVGEADSLFQDVKRCAEQMPNAEFVSLPGLDHGQGFRYSHEALPHVRQFLANVNQKVGSKIA